MEANAAILASPRVEGGASGERRVGLEGGVWAGDA